MTTTISQYVEIDLDELIEDNEDLILRMIRNKGSNGAAKKSILERLDLIEKQINNIRYDTENL